MFEKLFGWIKAYGMSKAIKELDQVELIFAAKIREAQGKLGQISPDQFSKMLVDEAQFKLCQIAKIDPLLVLTQKEIDDIRGK